jgi:septal ring factor EnvC (AmiA/AmiB activator)
LKRTIFVFAALAASTFAFPAGSQIPPSAPPARADVVGDRLQDIEKALKDSRAQGNSLQQKADDLARETAELRAALIRAARTTQEHEAALADLRDQLAELDKEEQQKTAALTASKHRMTELLGAQERLAQLPPEAMVALPATPQDTLRSAILLRAAVPQIEAQAKALRQEIEALAVVRDDITAKRAEQQAQTQDLAEERARLGALLARKATLEKQAVADHQKATKATQSLASEASDLRELLARIEADRKAREEAARKEAEAARVAAARAAEAEAKARHEAAQVSRNTGSGRDTGSGHDTKSRSGTSVTTNAKPATPSHSQVASLVVPHLGTFSKARGHLAFPAQGRMVQTFGERLSMGGESRGIVLETAPAAQVIAPYDGTVVFAGPFRDYGQLLIIEHGEGYHMLLAGFERIDCAVSQTLLAGEPVGVMARPADGNPRLYVELRHNGRPINPLPWLATPIGKVSG